MLGAPCIQLADYLGTVIDRADWDGIALCIQRGQLVIFDITDDLGPIDHDVNAVVLIDKLILAHWL